MNRDLESRETLIDSQPILWTHVMLEEARKAANDDARDAILARVGLTLFARFAVTLDVNAMRSANGPDYA